MSERGLMLPLSLRERFAGRDDIDMRSPVRGFTVRSHGRIYEARATSKIETRVDDSGDPHVIGYASTYDDPYDIGVPIDEGGWGWTEYIMPGAAKKSISELPKRDLDVFLFFDHDGLPLASAQQGTLALAEDGVGLRSDGTLDPASPYSMEVYRRVQTRQLKKMSFAFQVVRERWEDRDGEEESWITAPVRRILEVKLYDTSVVSFPANPNTSVDVKSGGLSVAEAKEMLAALRPSA